MSVTGYALLFKQLHDNPKRGSKYQDGIIDASARRSKSYGTNDGGSGEGDPGWWFPETLSMHMPTPIYAMPSKGPLKYLQLIYCLCNQFLPTPDFLPFVKSRLRGFTKESTQHNGLTVGKPTRRVVLPTPDDPTPEYNRPPGAGTIEMYASCCLDALTQLEAKLANGEDVPRLGRKQLEAVCQRPPLMKEIQIPGGGFSVKCHTPPWEPNSAAKGRVCGMLGLSGWESEGMCLFLLLGRESNDHEANGYEQRGEERRGTKRAAKARLWDIRRLSPKLKYVTSLCCQLRPRF